MPGSKGKKPSSKAYPTNLPVGAYESWPQGPLFQRSNDVDSGPLAHSHTLGPGPHQASDGAHIHDGIGSSVLDDYSDINHAHAQYALTTHTHIEDQSYVMRAMGPASGSAVGTGTPGTYSLYPLTQIGVGGSYGHNVADVNGSGEFVTPVVGIWVLVAQATFPNTNATGGRGVGFLLNGANPAIGSFGDTGLVAAGWPCTLTATLVLQRPISYRIGVGLWQNCGVAMNITYILQATLVRRIS